MKITIIKETEDLREGRTKILKKGTSFICSDDLAKQYIKKKLAKPYEAPIQELKEEQEKKSTVLKTVDEAEDYHNKID